ncbi:MAG: GxxExxY protein [Verrucomicrobiota bacterium]
MSKQIVDAAFKIHVKLGPGLLESDYEVAMSDELRKRGFDFVHQKSVPVH